MTDVWTYRGRRLRQMEWGLWRDLDRPGWFFLCYRPQGRRGPYVRRWACADGAALTLEDLQAHVRTVHAGTVARGSGIPLRTQAGPVLDEYLRDLERRNLSEKHTAGVRRACERFLGHSRIEVMDAITTWGIGRDR